MSSKETLEQFGSCSDGLADPRRGNAALQGFHELLMIALCCVLSGGQGAVDMAAFAEAKGPFLRHTAPGGQGFFKRLVIHLKQQRRFSRRRLAGRRPVQILAAPRTNKAKKARARNS